MDMKKRTIVLKVEPDFFVELKVHLARKGLTLHEYILGLINLDMNKLSNSL